MKWSEEAISYASSRYFDDGATYREIAEELTAIFGSTFTESSVRNMITDVSSIVSARNARTSRRLAIPGTN
jgi:hypothetical protein